MDDHTEPIERSKRQALLRAELAAAARGEAERASAVRADIETIALWLAQAAAEPDGHTGRARAGPGQ